MIYTDFISVYFSFVSKLYNTFLYCAIYIYTCTYIFNVIDLQDKVVDTKSKPKLNKYYNLVFPKNVSLIIIANICQHVQANHRTVKLAIL